MKSGFWAPLLIGFALGVNSSGLLNIVTHNTYKDGQIDAIRGNIKYELKVQKDGTTRWEYTSK